MLTISLVLLSQHIVFLIIVIKLLLNKIRLLTGSLGSCIYAISVLLYLVDNPYWIDFLKALRPAYKLPTRYDISNKLLDDEVIKVTDQNTICIADSKVLGVMCDGWTNVRN